MTVNDQIHSMMDTMSACLGLVNTKGRDYAPENVIFLDIFEQAYELQTSPINVLMGSHMRKHMAALRRYARDYTDNAAEPALGRAHDLTVYACLIAMFVEHGLQITSDVLQYHQERKRCKCESSDKTVCDHCLYVTWLQSCVTLHRSAVPSSSQPTPRPQD